MVTKTELHAVTSEDSNSDVAPIAKPPSKFSLDKFKSKPASTIANVETKLGQLPHFKIAAAGDFVRLHPDEETYWSPELCFVNGADQRTKPRELLHLIDEEVAMRFLSAKKIRALPAGAGNQALRCFLSVHIPTRTSTTLQLSNLQGCEQAKTSGWKLPPGRRKAWTVTRSIRPRAGCFPRSEVARAVAR